ncbi:MAG: cytochrome b561 [Lasallia pustulata]|uniref:Cytochrome b561 n=1 Tax=Lasallia pustulata TaxID=136370 RepID=A0A5M8Q078_9LECA|nr:MAG: cytochrome b561 [Lasallia pustulata]
MSSEPEENRERREGLGEEEPLLGRAGDASQQEGRGIQFNPFIGTAVLAQAGIWILAATVWASVFIHPLILFSAHPLLNSAGILLTTQAILILQPTHTPQQKQQGTNIHAILNGTSILALIAGLIIIEYNKIAHNGEHFRSPHAILGLLTYVFFILQALVGIAQYYIPTVFGSVDNAKAIYKYHRMSGYVLLVLAMATVAAATQTDYNKNVLGIQLWAVLVAEVITLAGVLPRIKKQKLGM